MKAILVALVFIACSTSALAARKPVPMRATAASINCETVRSVVSQLGRSQAERMARAHGMTDAQHRRALACL